MKSCCPPGEPASSNHVSPEFLIEGWEIATATIYLLISMLAPHSHSSESSRIIKNKTKQNTTKKQIGYHFPL